MQENRPLLTILLFLKGRKEFTFRWMSWMNEHHSPYPIYIADGSEDDSVERELQSKKYANLNYQYHYYGYDANYNNYFIKGEKALSTIETKYVIMADNDDFYFIEEFEKHLQFLEANDTYVGSYGRVDKVWIYNTKGEPNCVIGEKSSCLAYNQESIAQRLIEQMKNYRAQNYYSIYRTKALHQVHQQILHDNFKNIEFREFSINFGMLIFGSLNYIDEPFLYRQLATPKTSRSTIHTKSLMYKMVYNNFILELKIYEKNALKLDSFDADEQEQLKKEQASFMEFLVDFTRFEDKSIWMKLFRASKSVRKIVYAYRNHFDTKAETQKRVDTELKKYLQTNIELLKTLN